ncbi:MAG: LapA family protein [Desulfobacteraceae bacterium]|nr:LapA family protein [Desulfobacteraceae bacterium]MBU0735953.1 LapA family protein [Pseudomonadota bacterium]
MNKTKLVVILVLAVVGTIAVVQNTGVVETRILFFSVRMPHIVLLLSMTLIGFVLGILVSIRKRKNPR